MSDSTPPTKKAKRKQQKADKRQEKQKKKRKRITTSDIPTTPNLTRDEIRSLVAVEEHSRQRLNEIKFLLKFVQSHVKTKILIPIHVRICSWYPSWVYARRNQHGELIADLFDIRSEQGNKADKMEHVQYVGAIMGTLESFEADGFDDDPGTGVFVKIPDISSTIFRCRAICAKCWDSNKRDLPNTSVCTCVVTSKLLPFVMNEQNGPYGYGFSASNSPSIDWTMRPDNVDAFGDLNADADGSNTVVEFDNDEIRKWQLFEMRRYYPLPPVGDKTWCSDHSIQHSLHDTSCVLTIDFFRMILLELLKDHTCLPGDLISLIADFSCSYGSTKKVV
jgi:hypothetical protein